MKNNQQKMWGILVHLSYHMWQTKFETLPFDDDTWTYILEKSKESGFNTIVLDCGDGIQYATHPEISMNGAWSRTRVRREVARAKEMGINLIPKLNFSTGHKMWLHEYERMISTPPYYRLCNDLIHEVYELFDHPEYIHLGMDEEIDWVCAKDEFVVYRKGELFWHDLRYLFDCVHDTGAKPWIWADPLFEHTEEFMKRIDPEEVLLSPWYYNAFHEEHFTPIEKWEKDPGDGADGEIKFIEQIPQKVKIRECAAKFMEKGYSYVPTGSVYWHNDYNMPEMVEYFEKGAPKREQIVGYITAPWVTTRPGERNDRDFAESFETMKKAMEYYKSL